MVRWLIVVQWLCIVVHSGSMVVNIVVHSGSMVVNIVVNSR